MAITAAGISAAASAVSAVGGIFGAAAQRRFNAREAQKSRDFQERMSSTAYQRSMADMKTAGLNPILAYQQGGSSTPGGAVSAPSPNLGEAFTKGGIDGAMAAANLANLFAQNKNLKAQTALTVAKTAEPAAKANLWNDVSSAYKGYRKTLTIEAEKGPGPGKHVRRHGFPSTNVPHKYIKRHGNKSMWQIYQEKKR